MRFPSNVGACTRLFSMLSALAALLLATPSVMAETRTATVAVKSGIEIYSTGPHRGVVWPDGFGRVYADCHDPKDSRGINYACSGQISPALQANEIITSSSIKGLTLTTEIQTCPDAVDRGGPPFTNQQCVSGCPLGQYHRTGSDNTCYPMRVLVYPPVTMNRITSFAIAADSKQLPARMGCDLFELRRATVTGGGATLVSAKLVSTPATGCSVTLELSKPVDAPVLSRFVIEVWAKGMTTGLTNRSILDLSLPVPVL